ncbi:MAG: DEAD/DEAH box helicase family protein [Candidatus Thermoplasmatota archaeon]
MDLPEFHTRKQMIDVLLKEQGWIVGERNSAIIEVDTKQSNFRTQDYKTVSETLRNDLDSRYVDYLLLGRHGGPLAIVEAKRTSKDPIATAQKQAEDYADDIKKQLGRDVFIFMSNGYEIWFWDRERYPPRQIKGFYARDDIERLRYQIGSRKSLADMEIDTRIVDRTKSIENVKRVLEHIEKGHRKALIVMATGTGKTRVAMALIDCLRKANWVQRVLFLADRKALRDQAYNEGFKEFFPEATKGKIFSGVFERDKELYVSTIQTFMECYDQKDKDGKNLISPGDFDMIISDEAHRSIYNKWREVFTYLDAIQIGLTATPADMIEKNTFRFFNCTEGTPTALYDYEEAVKDGVLCDFRKHILGAKTHFQIKGVKKKDLTDEILDELIAKGIDPEDVNFEGTALEKQVVVTGTSEAIVREFMENCMMDGSGTLPAKTIFFAISKKHAKRLWEAFEKLYPEYKGKLTRIIVSEDSRAQELIDDFKKKSFPRVAISVDMMDTGIDVPEVCNLVFAKPVFSHIKFWQMIGRGTRSDNVCKRRDWLPNAKKEYFKIFDFWDNFEWHKMHPAGDEAQAITAITTRIFLIRLKQLELATITPGCKLASSIREKVVRDVSALPRGSVLVRENLRDVEKALSPKLWDSVGTDPLKFMKEKMAPLMRYKEDVDVNAASFTLKAERLGLAILEEKTDEIQRLKAEIGEMLECLPRTLDAVRAKEKLLDMVLTNKFWDDVTYEDSQILIDEFSALMRFKTDEPRKPIVLDMDDMIQQRKIIEFGPDLKEEYVDKYREKVERRIKELAERDPTMRKIGSGEALTEKDLRRLEETLNSPELYITEENLRKVFDQNKGTLVQFIKNLLGLYKFPDPTEKVRDAFQTYVIENNKQYNADQLNFIRTIQSVFVSKRHIEVEDLFDAPFTNFGTNYPIPGFSIDELNEFVEICGELEKELFAAGEG